MGWDDDEGKCTLFKGYINKKGPCNAFMILFAACGIKFIHQMDINAG